MILAIASPGCAQRGMQSKLCIFPSQTYTYLGDSGSSLLLREYREGKEKNGRLGFKYDNMTTYSVRSALFDNDTYGVEGWVAIFIGPDEHKKTLNVDCVRRAERSSYVFVCENGSNRTKTTAYWNQQSGIYKFESTYSNQEVEIFSLVGKFGIARTCSNIL